MIKVGTKECPKDNEPLHWHKLQGMRLKREIIPKEKAKRPYYVYDAYCPKCFEQYEVKA